MRTNFVKMSLAAAMLLGSSAFAGKIIGVKAATPWDENVTNPPQQYSFGGWNLENVDVRMTSGLTFYESDGTYDDMTYGDSFVSDVSVPGDSATIMATVGGKDWPVGEPAGIKAIYDDAGTKKSGKSPNCIMTTSYLDAEDSGTGESGYLDAANPVPTVCSSPFQSHKRFKVRMLEPAVNPGVYGAYGNPIDLVFNLDPTDTNATARRYQVFSKINNYTGVRLDGYKIQVLDENGSENPNIKFSLDISTDPDKSDESGTEAVFAHGLWGPIDKHFPENGFFDSVRAGFVQVENNASTLIGGPTTLGSNYVDLFGLWLPSKWAPYGIFFDDDNDPTTDAELIAFWGTAPDAPEGTPPAWHKGQAEGWVEPSVEELLTWMADPLYSQGLIEDTLNLGPNYVVEVGLNSTIGKTFTIRITPHVAAEANQTAPSYIMDDNVTYIMPQIDYNGTDVVLVISPAPYFTPGSDLSVGVADTALNEFDDQNETYIITVTTSGDEENLTLTETDVNSSIFVGTIGTDLGTVVQQDGTVSVVDGTVVSVTYKTITKTTTADTGTVTPPPVVPDDYNPSSGGGGCTYNPDSKSFDIGFLLMMAVGLLYPFRRRFIK